MPLVKNVIAAQAKNKRSFVDGWPNMFLMTFLQAANRHFLRARINEQDYLCCHGNLDFDFITENLRICTFGY